MLNLLKKTIFIIISLTSLVSFAFDLQIAKSSGLVGEKYDGYLGVIVYSSDLQNIVDDINNRRKQDYEKIANDSNQPIDVVEALAGAKLIRSTSPGQYYMQSNNGWVKK